MVAGRARTLVCVRERERERDREIERSREIEIERVHIYTCRGVPRRIAVENVYAVCCTMKTTERNF